MGRPGNDYAALPNSRSGLGVSCLAKFGQVLLQVWPTSATFGRVWANSRLREQLFDNFGVRHNNKQEVYDGAPCFNRCEAGVRTYIGLVIVSPPVVHAADVEPDPCRSDSG